MAQTLGKVIGKQLAKRAKALGLAPHRVALEADLAINTVRLLFNGETNDIYLGTLVKIAAVLDINPSDVIAGTVPPVAAARTRLPLDRLERVEALVEVLRPIPGLLAELSSTMADVAPLLRDHAPGARRSGT